MTRKIINLLFVLVTFSLRSFANGSDTIMVSQFGLLPDTRENSVKAVQAALEYCKTKSRPVLIFPKGRYDFWPEHSVEKEYFESNTTAINPKRCPVWIAGFHNLTIDANGSDFIYHGRVQPITIDHCEQVSILHVNIDWDIPLTAQAIVMDTAKEYIDIQIDSLANPYKLENGKIIFTGDDWNSRWWGTMEFKKDHTIVPQTGDKGVLGNDWENYLASTITSGMIRLKNHFTRKPSPGNVLVMRHSERDHAGIFIADSKNISLQYINLYATAGLGILSQYSENLAFQFINVVPNKLKGRYYSGHDDGCHFSNCRGKILLENCAFAGLMDDPVNVHGTAVQIIEKKSPTELRCRFMHEQSMGMEWAHTGDSIGFIRHQTMQTIGVGEVASFSALNKQDFILTFRHPVPTSILLKDALENITWTPDITIRHSLFGVNRARGILISTPGKVLIEKNEFESSGSAILIAGDVNQWFESGAVKDVVIRDNIFRDDCLTSMYQFCEAIISIDPEIPRLDPALPFHRNIVITGNHFNPYDYPVLYAKSVAGLVFSNNEITRSDRFAPFHPRKFMFTFIACKRVSITGNTIKGQVLGKNIQLKQMPRKELLLSPAAMFVINAPRVQQKQ